MTRAELIARIAERNPHLDTRDIAVAVRAIFERVAAALAEGDRVELRDFGTFTLRQCPARTGRNPRENTPIAVVAKTMVQFKPSRTMKARLNRWPLATGKRIRHLRRAL